MKLKIKVTKEHISRGGIYGGGSRDCPIALAVKELMPKHKAREVRVGPANIRLTRSIKRYPFSLPVERFIQRFDAGVRVKPITFVIELPKSYLLKKMLA
jgi:hypothetical protein